MIAFKKSLTIWFDDEPSTLTIDQVAQMTGTSEKSVTTALRGLEQSGFITRRPDGDYDATIPGGDS